MMKRYIGIDQYDSVYRIGSNLPRKWLLNYLRRKHADKMFIDHDGKSLHVGWVIGGYWIHVYEIKEMHNDATVNKTEVKSHVETGVPMGQD